MKLMLVVIIIQWGGELHWLPGYLSGKLILAEERGKLKILVLFAGHDTKSNVSENRIISMSKPT